MRCEGHVARTGERRGAYRALMGKPERKRRSVRLGRRKEYNIKMDLQEVGSGSMDWIDMDTWRTYVNVAMNLWFA
jgi:hypothetical protein